MPKSPQTSNASDLTHRERLWPGPEGGVNCWTPTEIDLDCTNCYSYPNPIADEMIGDVLKWMRENMIWVESLEDGVARCGD